MTDYDFVFDHKTWSHEIRKYGEAIIVVPYKKEFAIGTAKSIIKRIWTLSQQDQKDIQKKYNIKF